MKIVIYGLCITSSWGNGHATTYRSLARALARKGHRVHFVEKDEEWYRNNRDLPEPEYCAVHIYQDWNAQQRELVRLAAGAEAIVVGSYFPDAIAATQAMLDANLGPLLFYDIDTPITVAQLRATGRTSYLDPALIPHYAAYLSFTGGPVLRELEDRFRAAKALPFYCSVDPEIYEPTTMDMRYRCALSYLGTYAQDRQPKLMRLLNQAAAALPDKQFIVAGPQYPQEISWMKNVHRIIHLSPAEHPAFYSSSRFTLNLTRNDMVVTGYSPSVRLFEASACGAAILSDAWPGLEEFLTPGEEILLPKDEDDVTSILQHMTEAERIHMGRNARERILASHTAAHRASQFENVVAQCYAGRA